jgi:hypothetical protein
MSWKQVISALSVAAGVIGGVIQGFSDVDTGRAHAPSLRGMMEAIAASPLSLLWLLLVIIGIGLFVWDRRHPAATIRISAPVDGARVAFRQDVSGVVQPATAVAVYVKPRNGNYYKQWDPIAGSKIGHWHSWSQFGDDKSSDGDAFDIVAVTGGLNFPNSLRELPSDWRVSKPVHVKLRRS